MNKLKLICTLLFLGLFSISSTKLVKSKLLAGKYSWNFTFTENEAMLIKQKDVAPVPSRKGEDYISFSGSKFKEVRNPGCGNDISFNKTGTYILNSKQMILYYTGGTFSDQVGGDSMQAYIKGKVFYNVTRITKDTVFLFRTKGMSTKKIARTK
jgi:hypothetical protein